MSLTSYEPLAGDGLPGGGLAHDGLPGAGGHLDDLLREMVALGGSDLHLTAGIAPSVRVHGSLSPLPGLADITGDECERLVRGILPDPLWQRFLRDNELDTAYEIAEVSRFRVNVFRQRGQVGAVLRAIPHTIRSLYDLGLPPAVADLAMLPRGLVLVTGPTGSGKSTTLASLLDIANAQRPGHIVTIEDPIEYVHT
ncbi:type IV pilus twitching motility protein PilT, partial [Oryzihumus sp.]|uniref:type IV pilus twitching motility protein PilT n=1 Tax=Oryzihumus sp. TaxID=1968903 RepID=UPI002ED99A16